MGMAFTGPKKGLMTFILPSPDVTLLKSIEYEVEAFDDVATIAISADGLILGVTSTLDPSSPNWVNAIADLHDDISQTVEECIASYRQVTLESVTLSVPFSGQRV